MKDKKRFGLLMAKLRKEQKLTLDRLAYGLCTLSMLQKAEAGERLLDKPVRDRILERLGSTSDGYEVFLGCEDYAAYELRVGIMQCLEEKQFESAKPFIQTYRETYGVRQPIEEQFCLSVEAEIKKLQGADGQSLRELWRQAVYRTMPEIETKDITKLVLSPKELNLLLEYMSCQETENPENWYEVFLTYLEELSWEQKNMVYIYPKAVWYYCMYRKNGHCNAAEKEKLLMLCDKAIDMLRDTGRMYYLWELLTVQEWLLKESQGTERLAEIAEWKDALCFMVCEAYAPEQLTREQAEEKLQMRNFCYLYWEKGVHSIGDVIRIRRKMQGMTRKELCDGICAEKTLIAIEKKQRTPQEEIRSALFEKLNLSAEYQRRYLFVSEDAGLNELAENLSYGINNKEWAKAVFLLELLENRLDTDVLINKQFILRTKTLLGWRQKKISREEVIAKYQEVLNYTLDYETIFAWKEAYLTSSELLCLYNLMGMYTDTEKREFITFFKSYFEKKETQNRLFSCISEYELIMTHVASVVGNLGEFSVSNEQERKTMQECFRCYRMNKFHLNLHSIWWNGMHDKSDWTDKSHAPSNETWLRHCIALAELCNATYYAEKYMRDIMMLTQLDHPAQ